MKKNLFSLFLMFVSVPSFACTQETNKLSNYVGIDNSSGTIYATLSSDKKECGCGLARFSPSNTDTDVVLSILLTAKTANRPVRVDYKTKGDCNSAWRVYLK